MTTAPNTALAVCNTTIRAHNGLYSLNDLHKASGGEAKHQPAYFLRNEQAQALIQEIQSANSQSAAINTINGGRYRGTYACRELVIAYAAWISAAFQLKVIRVFLDSVAPAQPALPAPVLTAATVNDIVSTTTETILERLEKQCLLIHWRQIITAIKHEQTDIDFPELTDLTHACLKRLQRNIGAEAYSAIEKRAASQGVSTLQVPLHA